MVQFASGIYASRRRASPTSRSAIAQDFTMKSLIVIFAGFASFTSASCDLAALCLRLSLRRARSYGEASAADPP